MSPTMSRRQAPSSGRKCRGCSEWKLGRHCGLLRSPRKEWLCVPPVHCRSPQSTQQSSKHIKITIGNVFFSRFCNWRRTCFWAWLKRMACINWSNLAKEWNKKFYIEVHSVVFKCFWLRTLIVLFLKLPGKETPILPLYWCVWPSASTIASICCNSNYLWLSMHLNGRYWATVMYKPDLHVSFWLA